MPLSARKSTLCPTCRKLISIDESRCPHCGTSTPNARWKNNPLTRGLVSDAQLVRIIIFVNIGIYLFSLFISKSVLTAGVDSPGILSPSLRALATMGATGRYLIDDLGWWTLVSASYLHASPLHLVFNMLALKQIALLITQLYGVFRFFTIFTLGGVGGFLASYLMGVPITVGASAALCGLIGAALYYGVSRGGEFGQMVYRQIGGWATGILIFGFFIPQINNTAHIGGMLAGAMCAALSGYSEKVPEGVTHRNIASACMLITFLILLWSLYRGLGFWLGF